MIGHQNQRPVNGQDHSTRGRQPERPRPHRGLVGGRTQFLAWTVWVVLALLGLEYLCPGFSTWWRWSPVGCCCTWLWAVPCRRGWTSTAAP